MVKPPPLRSPFPLADSVTFEEKKYSPCALVIAVPAKVPFDL